MSRSSATSTASWSRCAYTCVRRTSRIFLTEEVERALAEGKTNPAEVEAIYRLTSLPTFEERFVVPPMERDTAVDAMFPVLDPVSRNYPIHKGAVGTGFHTNPQRGP